MREQARHQISTRWTRGLAGGVGALATAIVLFATSPAAAQTVLPLPLDVSGIGLVGGAGDLVYRIDLDDLPGRPAIVVEVEPDVNHPDIELMIELTDFSDPSVAPFSIGCPLNGDPFGAWTSDPSVGPARLEADLFFCDPDFGFWDGNDANVRIRATDFGSGGSPALLDVSVYAISRVPTELLVQQVSGSRTVTVTPSQDTVIYAEDDDSNGRGSFLWSGMHVFTHPLTGFRFYHRRNSLIGLGSVPNAVPANAILTDVQLRLTATGLRGGGGSVSLFAVGDSPTDASWGAGFANATGDEFFGASGSASASTYTDRTSLEPWGLAGGDTTAAGVLEARRSGRDHIRRHALASHRPKIVPPSFLPPPNASCPTWRPAPSRCRISIPWSRCSTIAPKIWHNSSESPPHRCRSYRGSFWPTMST